MPKMEDAVHTFTRAGFLLQTELLLALRFCCLLGTKAAKSTLFVFKPHYFSIEKKSVNVASLISNCEMQLSLNFLIIRYLNMTVTSCFLAKPVRNLIPSLSWLSNFIFHLLWQSLTEGKPIPTLFSILLVNCFIKPYSKAQFISRFSGKLDNWQEYMCFRIFNTVN